MGMGFDHRLEAKGLTENDIRKQIRALEEVAESGNLTVKDAQKLSSLRDDLKVINRARWPNSNY